MRIYNYHPKYGYYISTSYADESPLEPGVWLMPAYATEIEPPKCKNNQIQIFNGVKWKNVVDKRGTYYSTQTFESINNIDPLNYPENSTKEPPPDVPKGKILKWDKGWILEDDQSLPQLTPLEKLESVGLTIEELKTLLGLDP